MRPNMFIYPFNVIQERHKLLIKESIGFQCVEPSAISACYFYRKEFLCGCKFKWA